MPETQGSGPRLIAIDRRTALKGMSGFLGMLAAGAAVSACAGGEPSAGSSSDASGPKSGGQLSMATGDGLSHDFFIGNSFGPQALATYQFAWPLFRYTPGTFSLIPALAQDYEASPDGMTHTVTLRSGLTFHDGSKLTADDVAANLRAAFDEHDPLHGPGSYQMVPLFWGHDPAAVIGSVTAHDDQTVVLTLKQPRADVRGAMAFLPILHPRILRQKDYGTNVAALQQAGSGPFKLERFSPNEYAEYSKVPGFFEEARLDRLRLRLIADASARFLALRANQVQAAIGLSKADWDAAAGNPKYRTHVGNKANNLFLCIDARRSTALATDEKLRKALVMAMNRQAYAERFWGKGLADPADQLALAPGMPGYAKDLASVPYDPAGAKKLIAETGLSAKQLTFGVVSPAAFAVAPELRTLLSAIAGDWKAVGVTLNVHITDVAGWLSDKTNQLRIEPFGNSGGNSVAVAALYFANPMLPDSKTYSDMIDKARVAPNVTDQTSILRQLLKRAAQHVAGFPIAYTAPAALSLASVHDLAISAAPVDPQNQAWIER